MIMNKTDREIHEAEFGPIKDKRKRSLVQRLVGRTVCLLLWHFWTTYGWTGNTYWPTKGKECKVCKVRIPWDA